MLPCDEAIEEGNKNTNDTGEVVEPEGGTEGHGGNATHQNENTADTTK